MKLNPNRLIPNPGICNFYRGTYPQFVKFQAVQDRTGIVDGLKEGEKSRYILTSGQGNGRNKYFTNLNAWKVEKVAKAEVAAPAETATFRRLILNHLRIPRTIHLTTTVICLLRTEYNFVLSAFFHKQTN